LDVTLTPELPELLEPDEGKDPLKEGRFLAYSTAALILKDSNKELNSLNLKMDLADSFTTSSV
jgi:hypothetical protein